MDLSSSSSFESSKGDGRKLRANAATARTKPENYVRELGQCLLRDKEQEKEEKALCGILESLSTAAMRVQELGSILAIVARTMDSADEIIQEQLIPQVRMLEKAFAYIERVENFVDQVEQEVSRLEEMVEEFEDAILDPEDLILQPKMLINRAISFMSKSRQNIAGNRDLAAISKSKPRTKLQLLEHVCSSKINLSFPNLDDIEPQ